MKLSEKLKHNQLSNYELNKLREIIILYIDKHAAEDAIDSLPDDIAAFEHLRTDIVLNQYRILSIHSVMDKTGLSRSTIERMERDGKFPERVFMTDTRKGWHSGDISKWLRSRELYSLLRKSGETNIDINNYHELLRVTGLYTAALKLGMDKAEYWSELFLNPPAPENTH